MAVRVNYSMVADSAFFTKDTNNLNIIGIFDRIFVSNVPAVHPKMSLVVSINGDPGNYPIKIVLKKDGSTDAGLVIDGNVEIKNVAESIRMITELVNFPLTEAGKYLVQVKLNNESDITVASFVVEQQS